MLAPFFEVVWSLEPTCCKKADNVKQSVSLLRFVHFCKTRGCNMALFFVFVRLFYCLIVGLFFESMFYDSGSILASFWEGFGASKSSKIEVGLGLKIGTLQGSPENHRAC